jgi:hypothetical protein
MSARLTIGGTSMASMASMNYRASIGVGALVNQ